MYIVREGLEILKADQATGPEFSLPGKEFLISLQNYAGGTWRLQHKIGDDWFDLAGEAGDDAMQWNSKAVLLFYASAAMRYRLTGGTIGAMARAFPTQEMSPEELNYFGLTLT